MAQYGMTAQEAMDYIVKGTQNGLDKTNELGDNLSEYSGKFARQVIPRPSISSSFRTACRAALTTWIRSMTPSMR